MNSASPRLWKKRRREPCLRQYLHHPLKTKPLPLDLHSRLCPFPSHGQRRGGPSEQREGTRVGAPSVPSPPRSDAHSVPHHETNNHNLRSLEPRSRAPKLASGHRGQSLPLRHRLRWLPFQHRRLLPHQPNPRVPITVCRIGFHSPASATPRLLA